MKAVAVFAGVSSFAVVVCFVAALGAALPGPERFVVVTADPATPLGETWQISVSGFNERGPARLELPEGFTRPRTPELRVRGLIDGDAFSLASSVPVVAPDAGFTLAPPPPRRPAGLLPLHDGLPRARLLTTAPAPGDRIVVEADPNAYVNLFVGGWLRAVTSPPYVFLPANAKSGDPTRKRRVG
jgi:hypothetical protein